MKRGVDIFNVAGGKDTAKLVRWIRESYPTFPIMHLVVRQTSKLWKQSMRGANAITFTAYGQTEKYFQSKMEEYRQKTED